MNRAMAGAMVFAVLVIGASVRAYAAPGPNLVPNSSFESSIGFDPRDWKTGLTKWRFYEINLPIEGKRDTTAGFSGKASFKFSGTGKGFLHCGFFTVDATKKYSVSLYAKGGAPQAEVLWWKKEGVETDKEKLSKVALKKAGTDKGWTRYEGEVTSAADAKKAYVRIIATGNLSVDDVVFSEVP